MRKYDNMLRRENYAICGCAICDCFNYCLLSRLCEALQSNLLFTHRVFARLCEAIPPTQTQIASVGDFFAMTETNRTSFRKLKQNVIPEIKTKRHSGNFESSRNYPESQVTKNEIPAFAGMTEKKLE
jgi:hypothetical protein